MRSIKLFIAIIFFVLNAVSLSQQRIVEYKEILPGPFSNYTQTIGIAIFPFIYNDTQTNIDSIFYKDLTKALGKEEKFIIYLHRNLETLKNRWGIINWDAENKKVQEQLNNKLDIKLIVYAVLSDPGGDSFLIKILNTKDGQEIFSEEYKPSIHSNAITDAVKLFTENKKAEYKELGTLIVNTIPEDKFQVYINNDRVGETPCKKYLPGGKYELVIDKDDYKIYRDSISIEPGKELRIKPTMVPLPIIGSLEVSVFPDDVNIELYKADSLINKGIGFLFIDTLDIGEYKILAHRANYISQSKIIRIQRDQDTTVNIPLQKELMTINKIVTESGFIKNLQIGKYNGYYTFFYDLLDEEDEDYQIKLLLLDKSNEKFSYELQKLSGNIGKGKFYGTGKMIKWNWADEFKGGIANDNLYLKLTAEKLSGGIPWYVWVGGAVLGGTAAAILGGKKGNDGGTNAVSIPAPPSRPGN